MMLRKSRAIDAENAILPGRCTGYSLEGVMAIASAIAEKPSAPSPIQGSGIASFFFIGLPVLLVALCLAAMFRLSRSLRARAPALSSCCSIALMLTGMPVSIALGLTVLIFVFTLTKCPFDAVALKLFTGIERFEIMAIPFFILAGAFSRTAGWRSA